MINNIWEKKWKTNAGAIVTMGIGGYLLLSERNEPVGGALISLGFSMVGVGKKSERAQKSLDELLSAIKAGKK